MSYLHTLRDSLEVRWPGITQPEMKCSCGAENHACIHFYSVNGHLAAVVLPETRMLAPDELARVLGHGPVEPLTRPELEAALADTELGHSYWFENPFGFSIFFDGVLLEWPELVFCPRMFGGGPEQCMRIATERFVALAHPLVLPHAPQPAGEANAWAV